MCLEQGARLRIDPSTPLRMTLLRRTALGYRTLIFGIWVYEFDWDLLFEIWDLEAYFKGSRKGSVGGIVELLIIAFRIPAGVSGKCEQVPANKGHFYPVEEIEYIPKGI